MKLMKRTGKLRSFVPEGTGARVYDWHPDSGLAGVSDVASGLEEIPA